MSPNPTEHASQAPSPAPGVESHWKSAEQAPPTAPSVPVAADPGREVCGFLLRRDGARFPMELSVSEFRLNQQRMFVGMVRDVSERKRTEAQVESLNRKLAARNAELEIVNSELEAFNYSLSHDLRTQLSQISLAAPILGVAPGRRRMFPPRRISSPNRWAVSLLTSNFSEMCAQ